MLHAGVAHRRLPPPTALLLVLLCLIPLLSLNNFFAYHAPGAIGASLIRVFGLDPAQFGELFTIYSAPNVVLVFFGGVWVDRYGMVSMSLLFNSLMLAGMMLFAIAPAEPETDLEGRVHASTRSMAYLLGGRLLLGLGGECLCAAASAMIGVWFKGSGWLTFACGFNQAFVQMFGSAAAFLMLPKLMKLVDNDHGRHRHGANVLAAAAAGAAAHGHGHGHAAASASAAGTFVPLALSNSTSSVASSSLDPTLSAHQLDANVRLCLWVTVGVCVLSFASNLLYAMLEWRYKARYMPSDELDGDAIDAAAALRDRDDEVDDEDVDDDVEADRDLEYETIQENTALAEGLGGGGVLADSYAQAGDSFATENEVGDLLPDDQPTSSMPGTPEPLSSWDAWKSAVLEGDLARRLGSFPLLFWLVLAMHCALSPILYTFTAFGVVALMERYGMDESSAGEVTSVLYVSIVLSPLVGYLVDKVGYRSVWQVCAACVIPLALMTMAFTDTDPYLIMISLGVAYAVTETNGLAMIAVVVPSSSLGTAYGLLGCGISLALLFEPLCVGLLKEATGSYSGGTFMFVAVSAIGCLMAMVVHRYDEVTDQIMCRPPTPPPRKYSSVANSDE